MPTTKSTSHNMSKQMNHLYDAVSLDRLEATVVHECANLLNDLTFNRRRMTWVLSRDEVESIRSFIGERLTLLSLRTAGYRPDSGSDDWHTDPEIKGGSTQTVKLEHPEDFGLCLQSLDVRQRLQKELGLC